MFKRYAMSAIELVDTKGQKRVAFEGADKSVVSFEYDPENYVYFRCRAITADAPNGNGDFFPKDELRKAYKTFVGVGMYKDHDSDSVDKSVGKVLWAEYVEIKDGNDYVECYCCIDRKLDPGLARRIEMGQANTVSMGCMVGEAQCGVKECGNIAHNQLELCEHMMPGRGVKGKKGADGVVAYEINKLLQFTELSLVTVPADPTAHIFEVFAGLKAGTISAEDARRIIREEIASVVGEMKTKALMDNVMTITSSGNVSLATVSPTTVLHIESLNSIPEAAKAEEKGKDSTTGTATAGKEVARIPKSMEETMNLTISYERAPKLANAFFVAKEAGAEFRVSAADVLPLLVQEAIATGNTAGIATPEQVVADLRTKCAGLSDFKKWAKKRKKKNRKAFERAKEDDKSEDKAEASVSASPAVADAPAAPVADAPSGAGTEVLNPNGVGDSLNDSRAPGDAGDAHTDEPAEGAGEASKEEIQLAIQELTKRLEEMQAAAPAVASSQKKKAVKTQENVNDKRDNGASNGKASPAKMPTGINEIAKTENPKGHMEKGASIKATAAEKDAAVWSVNQKEIEKLPAVKKPAQAAPPDVTWSAKEMASEQIKLDKGGNAGSAVKKFYNRLPSGGLGEAPKALDLKSKKDDVHESLRKRAEEAEAENLRLKEKEKLAQVADKIYEIVKALREKNLLTAEKEDEVITHLGSSFKDLALLDAVTSFVSKLAAVEPRQSAVEAGPDTADVVPQVFEPISQTEDAISAMSKIWNL